jgi:hypothetical protein
MQSIRRRHKAGRLEKDLYIIRDKQLLMLAEQNSTAEFVLGIRFVNLEETIATNAPMPRTMSLSDTTAH